MAPVLVEKTVLFIGVWRTPSITDNLLRDIALQKGKQKGYPTRFQITTSGLMLHVRHSTGRTGRTDPIPIQAVYDITVNRHDPLCLLCVFSDALKRINLMVCYCGNDIDASDLVDTFRQYKKSLSGEGFNFDLKQPDGKNWTLKTSGREGTKSTIVGNKNNVQFAQNGIEADDSNYSVSVLCNSEQLSTINANGNVTDDSKEAMIVTSPMSYSESPEVDREEFSYGGMVLCNVGVQTGGISDDDEVQSTTSHSSAALRHELLNLSQEIREIKLIIEEATGISASEYLRRQKARVENHNEPEPETITWQRVHVDEKNDDPLLFENQTVNLDTLPDHDARSYGTQTLPKKRYARKEKSNKSQSSGGTANAIRNRLKIDSSSYTYNDAPTFPNNNDEYYQQVQRYQENQYPVTSDAGLYKYNDNSTPNFMTTKAEVAKKRSLTAASDPNNNAKLRVSTNKTTTTPDSLRIKNEKKEAKHSKKYHSLKLSSTSVLKPIEDVYKHSHTPRHTHRTKRNTVLVYPSDWENTESDYSLVDSGYRVHAGVGDYSQTMYQKDMDVLEVEMQPN